MPDLTQYLGLVPGTKQAVYCCKASKKTAVVYRDEDRITFWCARCGLSETLRTRRSLNWIKNLGHKFLRHEDVQKLPPDMTETLDSKTLEWLGKYGIPAASAIKYGVRYSEMLDRAVLQVKNTHDGDITCAQYRALTADQNPKYLTSVMQGTDQLYFPHVWEEQPRSPLYSDSVCYDQHGTIVLVEDVLSAIKIRLSMLNVYSFVLPCAILGTHLSTEKAHVLAALDPQEVYLWFDPDAAGEKASQQIRQKIELFNIPVKTITSFADPKEHTRDEIRKIIIDLKGRT